EAAGDWRIESVEGSLEGEVLTDLADVRKNWMDEDPDEHDPGLIQQIGQALQVDGLMVLSIRKERVGSGSWQAAEITLMFLTMDAPLFYSIASPDVGIWIYESASGNLVWSQEAADASKHGHDGGFMPEDLPDLLLDLENAVPAQLIQ
ncbi:MAG TPA: hypothetical protein VK995_01550, partial [Oceanipulchritudo sp.]|nr:hypothetical protein [Oceanipulchritudo sp.]